MCVNVRNTNGLDTVADKASLRKCLHLGLLSDRTFFFCFV